LKVLKVGDKGLAFTMMATKNCMAFTIMATKNGIYGFHNDGNKKWYIWLSQFQLLDQSSLLSFKQYEGTVKGLFTRNTHIEVARPNLCRMAQFEPFLHIFIVWPM
jgi:hypothetical protein